MPDFDLETAIPERVITILEISIADSESSIISPVTASPLL